MKDKIIKNKNRIISISLLIMVSLIGIITVFTNDFDDSKVTDKLAIDNEYIQDDTIRAIKHQEYDYLNADKQLIAKGIVDASKIDNAKVKVLDNNTSVITFKSKKDAENYADKTNGVYFNDSITIQDAENEATSTEENSETNKSSDVTYDSSNTTDNDSSSEKHSELLDYLQSQDYGKNDVTVAVIDSGITVDSNTKNVFNDRVLSGVNYSATKSAETNGNEATDDNGHGTSISYIIAQSTSDNVKLLPIKVIDSAGKGTLLSLYQGIKYAIEQNVDVINISLSTASTHSELIKEAIDEANAKGIIVVAAAGNYGTNVKYYTPAKFDNVITVASVNEQLQHSDFSNYGDAIDYATIGENVYTESYNGANNRNGTSYSAAKLSAIVSYFKAIDKSVNTKELKNILNQYVLPSSIDKKYIGNGILSLESVSIDKNNHVEISENTVYKSILDYDNWKKLSNDKFTDIINNSEFKNTVIWWQNLSEKDKEYAKNKFTKLTENVETYDENHNKINKKYFELLDNYNLDSVNAESIARAGYAYLGIYLNGKCDSYDTINTYTHKYKDSQSNDVWSPSGYYGKIDINCAHTTGGICGGISNLWAGVFKDSGSCFFYGGFNYGTPSQESNNWLKQYNAVYLGRDNNGWWAQSDGTATCDESVWQGTHATLALKYACRHTIHFDGNGGNNPGIADQTKQWGSVLYLSSVKPTTPGYEFTGWNTKSDGTGTTYQPGSAYGSDLYGGTVTLYAQWKVSTRKITFKSNGGVWLNSQDDDIAQTYNTNQEITLDNSVGNGSYIVSKPGYKLTGWADISGDSDTETSVLNNRIHYDFNDPSSYIKRVSIRQAGDNIEFLVYVNSSQVAKVQCPTWTVANGQDDLTWHDTMKGSWGYEGYNFGGLMSMKTSHKDYNSRYITHIYAYDSRGNKLGSSVAVPISWAPKISSNDGVYKVPTVNSRLTAIWQKLNNGQQFFKGDKNSSVTVTYKPYTTNVKKNGPITVPSNFTTDDGTKYYFKGYYLGNTKLIDDKGAFTQAGLNFERFSDTYKDKTLEAKWTKTPPEQGTNHIYYEGNGGTGSVPATTINNSTNIAYVRDNIDPGFKNSGKTFTGWNTEPKGTGTTYKPGDKISWYPNKADMILYAQWKDSPPPIENSQYKFVYYKQNLDYSYTKAEESSVYTMNYNQFGQGWYARYDNKKSYSGYTVKLSNFSKINNQYYALASDTKNINIINVYFDRNKYTVSVTGDNGFSKYNGAGTYRLGEKVTISAILKDGYVFNSWNNNSSMKSNPYTFTMPSSNCSYTASSIHTPFTLTVNPTNKASNGVEIKGTWNNKQTSTVYNPIYCGNTKTIASAVSNKAGYKFKGWTITNSSNTKPSQLSGTTYTQGLCNTTLQANYEPLDRKYYVNIYYENANDNNYSLGQKITLSSKTDATVSVNASSYLKTGFTFNSSKSSGLSQVVSGDTSKPTTFNLYYTRNRLTINYHANGGTISNQPYRNATQNKYYVLSNSIVQNSSTTNGYKNVTTVIKYDQSNSSILNPDDANITRRGYKISDYTWKTTDNMYLFVGNKQSQEEISSINNKLKSGNASVTLYLQWNAQAYHLVLDNQMVEKVDVVNNGTTDLYEYYDNGWYLDAQLTKNTSKITIPQWKGRTFQGYYTAVSGGTQIIDANGNILAKNNWIADDNITVYAHWSRNKYTVDLNPILDDICNVNGYSDIKFNVYRQPYSEPSIKDDSKYYKLYSNVQDFCESLYYKDYIKFEIIPNNKYTYNPKSNTNNKLIYEFYVTNNIDFRPQVVTKPIINDVLTKQASDSTFTIYANVSTTPTGIIKSVKFPTWTNEAGQDDISSPWYEAVKGNYTVDGKKYNYAYTVNVKNHIKPNRDEYNWYNTHVYAYDKFDGFNTKATTFNFRYNLKLNYNKPSNATSTINNSSETSRIIIYKNKLGTNNGSSKALPIPSMRGWTFNGWYTAANGGTKVDDNTIFTWHTATTIYAHWTANTYTITLNSDDADYSHGTNKIFEHYDDAYYLTYQNGTLSNKTTTVSIPIRKGYSFLGYYTEKNGKGTQIVDNKGNILDKKANYFASNATIYAHWKINTYTLTVKPKPDNEGGETAYWNGTSKASTFKMNFRDIKEIPLPTRRGYDFQGWEIQTPKTSNNIYGNGKDTTILEPSTITISNGKYWYKQGDVDTVIVAKWKAHVYTITLDNQQADYAGTTVIYEKYDNGFYFDKNCTKVVSKIDKPKKQGNTFMRYYLPKNLSDKQGTQGNTIIAKNLTMAVKNNYFAEDITITAEWQETTYHIIFNGNRNTSGSTAAQEFKKSKPIILRTNGFGRTGWTYANKWNSAANGSRYTYNEASQLTWELFKREFTKEQLMSEEELKLNLYAQWIDTITPVISNVSIEQETLLSEVTKNKITLVSNKGFDGNLFTNISVKVNENNSGNDASGIREVHAYVYDKANKGNYKDYQLTIDNSKTVQTKYDFYYNGVKYPYSSTYKFKVNLYNEPQFRHSADLGIYIYAIDYQGNSSLTHETLQKLQNNNDKTIPEIDVPQSKPIIKDNPSNSKPPSNNNKPWDVIYHEVNECIYTTYLTAEGTNNFFAGELGIASVWTYGYVEHIDLDYDADTRYKINTEMETEIAENQLSEDNRMNRGYDIPNGINTLSTVWIQPVRIPPYVLQHLSTPSTTKQHSDGTTAYNDLLDIKYSSIGTKHSTKTDAYNSYNIQDAEYQDVHYRSGI